MAKIPKLKKHKVKEKKSTTKNKRIQKGIKVKYGVQKKIITLVLIVILILGLINGFSIYSSKKKPMDSIIKF